MKKLTIIVAVIFAIGGAAYSLTGGQVSVDPEFDRAMDLSERIQNERIQKSKIESDTSDIRVPRTTNEPF